MSIQQFFIYWALSEAALIFITWVFFSAVMRFQMLRDAGKLEFRHHPLRWIMAHVALWVGLVLDTLVNWRFCTVSGLEFPKEFLTTKRLNRWYNTPGNGLLTRWRRWLAGYFGDELLNDVDPSGEHIKKDGGDE